MQNYNYLLFHSIVEVLGIIPSFMVFIIVVFVWDYLKENNFLSFIGLSFFFIGLVDFIHILAYEGMNVFPEFDANLPTQLWILARYIQVISVLIAAILISRKKHINGVFVFIIYSLVTSISLYLIFVTRTFPDCFIVGQGLTDFKIISEYIMVLLLAVCGGILYKHRHFFTNEIFQLLMISIVFQIASELSFTTFASLYGYANFLGHVLKIVWIVSFFRAVISTALLSPNRALYMEVVNNEEKLRINNIELNNKISELDLSRRTLLEREQELSKMNNQLEEIVAERTREVKKSYFELKQANIITDEARKEAELASEAKGNFLANMSHEIRTPLNAVIGYNHLLSKTNLSNQQKSYLEMMDSSSSNLLAIVNDILDFSRIEAGKIELLYVEVNTYNIINKILDTITYHVFEKNLELKVKIDESLPEWVMMDEGRISQVLLNLLSNAVKFTEKGSVVVRFEVIKNRIVITVQDTGIGVDNEDIKHIFDHFSQANTGIKRTYGGTGLGLAITKKIIDLMEGSITFSSEKGLGSTVVVSLPLIQCQRRVEPLLGHLKAILLTQGDAYGYFIKQLKYLGIEVAKITSIDEIHTQQAADYIFVDWHYYKQAPQVLSRLSYEYHSIKGIDIIACGRIIEIDQFKERHESHKMIYLPLSSDYLATYLNDEADSELVSNEVESNTYLGKRILLVEDNVINQELQRTILTDFGAAVIIADNGKIAVEKVKNHFFDLIIMDIHMPIMDGFEATKKIRELKNGKIVPIIAMTADAQNEVEEKVLSNGMNDIIMKPINISRCHEVISKWIK